MFGDFMNKRVNFWLIILKYDLFPFALSLIGVIIKYGRDKMVCSDGGGVCLCLSPAQQQK
jgi:hypothetical protein